MNLLNKISKYLAVKASPYSANASDPENIEVLEYGIYVFIADITKNFILFTISFFLDLLFYSIFTYIGVGILRTCMGGVHSKTFWGCLVTNLVTNLGIAYIAKGVLNQPDLQFIITSFIVCICAIIAYAPADIENNPIRDIERRKKRRLIAMGVSILFLGIALIIKDTNYSSIIAFSFLINSISLLPIMYKITKNRSGEFYDNPDVNTNCP